MADTYGVLPSDVAAEMPGLYPSGFSPALTSAPTTPTALQVAGFIATADSAITLRIKMITGAIPAVTDDAALLAKRYILNWAITQALRVAYIGNDPAAVAGFTQPYDAQALEIWNMLTLLGAEDTGIITPIALSVGAFPVIGSFRIANRVTDDYARPVDFPVGNI